MRELIIRCFLLLVLCLSFSFEAKATHIIGGELTYSCLGNNKYEIRLTVFRDCFYGVPPFDETASIGVFNSKNQLLQDVRIAYTTDDTIKQVLVGLCKVIPPNVCVHTTTYIDTITLNPILGGYTLVYQRCCRNQTLKNIVNPLETGASFTIKVTEKALLECNNSAKFKSWPPIYICANEPIDFDHSAIDLDGDSLVYKLCTPINGLDSFPQPQPPNNPPYDNVIWKDPPYNLDNLLGGIPLAINPFTGFLSGTPNTIGQFVVGVCIEEYRDGELISQTNRDFQYNVGLCGETFSSFFTPDIICDTLNVSFSNLSLNANNFLWDFGVLGTNTDQSILYNPSFVYPDTGTYIVTLIAQPGTPCIDTFSKAIRVYRNTLIPNYKTKVLSCTDSLVVEITDTSIDTGSVIISRKYYASINGILVDSSEVPNPVFVFPLGGNVSVTLIVENALGCVKQRRRTIIYPKVPQWDLPYDTLKICLGDTLQLQGLLDTNFIYKWTPAVFLSNPSIANPLAFPEVSTSYKINVKDKKSICNSNVDLTILVNNPSFLNLPDTIKSCDSSFDIVLYPDSLQGIVKVFSDPNFQNILSIGKVYKVTNLTGIQKLYLSVMDTLDCGATDSIVIQFNGFSYTPFSHRLICPGEITELILNYQGEGNPNAEWSLPSLGTINGDSLKFQGNAPGIYSFAFEIKNDFGCLIVDTAIVRVIDTTGLDLLSFQQCAGKKLTFQGIGPNAGLFEYVLLLTDTIIVFKGLSNWSYTFSDTGSYVLKSYILGAACIDTVVYQVQVSLPSIVPSIGVKLLGCIDSLQLLVYNNSVGSFPAGSTFKWFINNEIKGSNDSLLFTSLGSNSPIIVSFIINQNNGCVDTVSASVNGFVIPSFPNDTFTICAGETVQLNPGSQQSFFDFLWEPKAQVVDFMLQSPNVSPTSNISYTASVTTVINDSLACNYQFINTVLVNPLPSASFDVDSLVCELLTTISVVTDLGNTIQWKNFIDSGVQFGDQASFTFASNRLDSVFVIITSINGCQLLDTFEFLNNRPFIQLNDLDICLNDTVQLFLSNLISTDQLTCQILSGGAVFQNQDEFFVVGDQDKQVIISCTNQFGCISIDTVNINVFNFIPPLLASADPDTLIGSGTVQLNSTFDPNYSYYWDPATNLSNPNIFNPTAIVDQTVTYTVSIENQDGCRNQASVTILVRTPQCDEPFIFIPNAFSPNNDNSNDEFKVRGESIVNLEMQIWNRWGERVFYSQDKNTAWDGTFNGEALSPDVYGYYVKFDCGPGTEIKIRKGNVSLVR